jgi:hypothetical protein
MMTFILKNDNLVLKIFRASGALVSLSAVRTDRKTIDRPQLGFFVPPVSAAFGRKAQ